MQGRYVQVQFKNYEKSKDMKTQLKAKRGIGELAFQAQTTPIPLLTLTFHILIFFNNSFRFTFTYLPCVRIVSRYNINSLILLKQNRTNRERTFYSLSVNMQLVYLKILILLRQQYLHMSEKFICFFQVRQIFSVIDSYDFDRWELILVLFCNKSVFRISVSGDDEDAVC